MMGVDISKKPDRESVLDELDRVVASQDFANKPVMRKLLAYLVTETLEGRSKSIKGYSIAVDVFGQGGEFDPNSSALVRNNAVRLRTLLKTYYLDDGRESLLHIDIPKGGYVPRFLPGYSGSDESQSPPKAAPDRIQDILPPQPPSISVLPFRNLTKDPGSDYLAIGFPRALADEIAKFELRVVGAHSVSEEAATGNGFNVAARDMGVDFVVEGEIAALGGRVKVSCRLISTSDMTQLWSDSFKLDIAEDNVFEVQEETAARIAGLVGGEYGYVNKFRYQAMLDSRPQSPNEQEILLKNYYAVAVLSDKVLNEFLLDVEEALKREPDSALIHACASAVYSTMWPFAYPSPDETLAKFVYHAEKAYDLNPGNQWALGAICYKCFVLNETDRFYMLFDKHKDWLANSPLRLGAWAMYICFLGDWERGKPLLDKVFDHNADTPSWLRSPLCMYHFRQCNYEAALVEANKIQVPGLFWGPAMRIAVMGQLGQLAEAEKELTTLLEYRPDFLEKGRQLLSVMIKEPDLLDHFLDGFSKTGVTIA